jgi:type II secretory pathway pseudopilin PulG
MYTGGRFTGVALPVPTRAAPRTLRPAPQYAYRRTGRLAPAFSLIEAVIVLLIIGIISAIAAPRYANALARQRVDAAARRIVADLSVAQRQAKSASMTQTVDFDLTDNLYRLLGMQHLDHASREYQVLLSQEPYQVTIVSADFSGTMKVRFDGYGVPDTGGTVVIQAGQYQKTISVDADTGRATVQ